MSGAQNETTEMVNMVNNFTPSIKPKEKEPETIVAPKVKNIGQQVYKDIYIDVKTEEKPKSQNQKYLDNKQKTISNRRLGNNKLIADCINKFGKICNKDFLMCASTLMDINEKFEVLPKKLSLCLFELLLKFA